MARQIKFKAWDDKNKKWMWPYPEGFSIIGEVTVFDTLKQQCLSIEDYNFIKICEFTGLVDKSGKEIYEGDVFKLGAEKEVFEVRFQHGCFMAFCNGKQYGLIGELQVCFIEVTGNIYENQCHE